MQEAQPPAWAQAILDEHGIEVAHFGNLFTNIVDGEAVFGEPIFACVGLTRQGGHSCCCWFVFSDNRYIDRYSFVNEDGWCQGQNCPCHDLPRQRPDMED